MQRLICFDLVSFLNGNFKTIKEKIIHIIIIEKYTRDIKSKEKLYNLEIRKK